MNNSAWVRIVSYLCASNKPTMPTRKTAPKKTAASKEPKVSPKARKPSQLDRIEATISKVHEELISVRSIAHHARTAARVNTTKLDTILASLSQPSVEVASERVFTESEVRAMVHEIATTASLMQLTRSDVFRLGEKHGVTPDPA